MGLETTSPDKVNSSLHKIYEQISLRQIDEAKKLIAVMKGASKGDPELLIGSDPDLTKAEVLIKRRQIIDR